MKSIFENSGFAAFIGAGSIFSVNAQDAATILKNMDNVMYSPKDINGKNKIILIDKKRKKEVREATVQQKGTDKRMFPVHCPCPHKPEFRFYRCQTMSCTCIYPPLAKKENCI